MDTKNTASRTSISLPDEVLDKAKKDSKDFFGKENISSYVCILINNVDFESLINENNEVLIKTLKQYGFVTKLWHRNDIKKLAKTEFDMSLKYAQVSSVLRYLETSYKTHIGINYTVVKDAIKKIIINGRQQHSANSNKHTERINS